MSSQVHFSRRHGRVTWISAGKKLKIRLEKCFTRLLVCGIIAMLRAAEVASYCNIISLLHDYIYRLNLLILASGALAHTETEEQLK